MGNILCRESKSPRRVYVKKPINKSPINHVVNDGYQTSANNSFGSNQIHSNSLNGTSDSSTKRQRNEPTSFFHSVPNLTPNGYKAHSMTVLDAKIFDNGTQRPPVAPPRKKRATLKKGSTLPTTSEEIRNGFKDVFGKIGPVRRSSYDDIEFIDKDDNTLQTRATSDMNMNRGSSSSPERKLKIGNKKSDKFFGENLSDSLSDEPISLESSKQAIVEVKEDIEKPIEEHEWRHSEQFNNSLDKKAEFLMAMLDEQERDDEEKYKNKVPVEEPLFVARKKEIKKHICDDDEHMHMHFHNHEKGSCDHIASNDEPDKVEKAPAPPKPDRDFTKYVPLENEKPSEELKNSSEVLAPLRIKRVISRDNLPTPPATPKRKSGIESTLMTPGTPTIKIESVDFKQSSNLEESPEEQTDDSDKKRPAPLLITSPDNTKKSSDTPSPTTPILTNEMVDQMIKKAYGFQGYHPEDIVANNHDDGSDLVAPTSKLTTRKISVTRKISTESSPSLEGDNISQKSSAPPSPRMKKIVLNDDSLKTINENGVKKALQIPECSQTPPKSPNKFREHEKLLNSATMNDIIDEIYSKNSQIMQEFQSYLEQSVEKEPVINVDDEKEFLDKKGNQYIAETVVENPKPRANVKNDDEDFDNQSYSDSFESTDTEQETVRAVGKDKVKVVRFNHKRRESIEDVDTWFNDHLDIEEKKSELCGTRDSGQHNLSTYDTQKIFPFGTTITGRRDSLSDEFFVETSNLLRPRFDSVRESDGSATEDEKSIDTSIKSPDHSTLFKFFDKNEVDVKK